VCSQSGVLTGCNRRPTGGPKPLNGWSRLLMPWPARRPW